MHNVLAKIDYYREVLSGNSDAMIVLNQVAESYREGGIYETKNYVGKIITTPLEFKRLVRKICKLEDFAFDTEFTSLRMQAVNPDWDFVACSFSWGKYHNYYIPVGHVVNETGNIPLGLFTKGMKEIFERKNYRLVGHNLKAEIHALAQIGVEVMTDDLFDTLVAMWNLDENDEVGLKHLTKREYDYNQTEFKKLLQTISPENLEKYQAKLLKERNISMVDMHISAFYALDDTFWTWQLYIDSFPLLESEGVENFYLKRQMPYLKVLTTMERRGVLVNKEQLEEMSVMAEKDLEEIAYQIYELAGIEFSITSGQQLAELLFGWRKEKAIYEENPVYEFDADGEPVLYKSGKNKGLQKFKMVKNKEKIVGYEFSGNTHILDASFNFPTQGETKTGQPKTGADELDAISKLQYKRDRRKKDGVELVKLVLRFKRLEKLRSTYMLGLAEQVYPDGKIHCSFNQTGTTSGRLSCSSPNLQQLPRPIEEVSDVAPKKEDYPDKETFEKAYDSWESEYKEFVFWKRYEIRSAFISHAKKKLVAGDWSNLEMRVLTHFSQDPLLLNMFATGVDAHGDTAKNMFKLDCTVKEVKKLYPHLRQQAKTINFLLVYGGSASALSSSLGVPKAEAQVLYDLYFETYRGVKKYVKDQKRVAHGDGFVQTVLGRKRHLENFIWSKNFGEVGYAERLSVNAPIQGSAADIAVSAQILVEYDEELNELGFEQLLQVHDEIVGECPEENADRCAERLKEIMAECLPRKLNGVELEASVDTGVTYAEAK